MRIDWQKASNCPQPVAVEVAAGAIGSSTVTPLKLWYARGALCDAVLQRMQYEVLHRDFMGRGGELRDRRKELRRRK